MKCSFCIFTICVTILFTIFIVEIQCCSDNTYDIISLMSEPNYQQNPCYIRWKAAQDAKLTQLWRDRAVLEESIARNNRISDQNEKQEQENWQNSFRSVVVKKKESSVLMILGIVVGSIVGICCCLACCAYITSEEYQNAGATTDTLQSDRNPGALATTMLTSNPNNSDLIVSAMETQQTTLPSRECTPQHRHTAGPRQLTEADAHLLPMNVINRQNSLPTYEDAIAMPSAPPKE